MDHQVNASLALQNELLLYENNKLTLSLEQLKAAAHHRPSKVKHALRALSRSLYHCASIFDKRLRARLSSSFFLWRVRSLQLASAAGVLRRLLVVARRLHRCLLAPSFSRWRAAASLRSRISNSLSTLISRRQRRRLSSALRSWRTFALLSVLSSSLLVPSLPPSPASLLPLLVVILRRAYPRPSSPRAAVIRAAFKGWQAASQRLALRASRSRHQSTLAAASIFSILERHLYYSSLRLSFSTWLAVSRGAARRCLALGRAAKAAARALGRGALRRWNEAVASCAELDAAMAAKRLRSLEMLRAVANYHSCKKTASFFYRWRLESNLLNYEAALLSFKSSFQLHYDQQSEAHRLHHLSTISDLSLLSKINAEKASLESSRFRLASLTFRRLILYLSRRHATQSLSRSFHRWSTKTLAASSHLTSLAGTLVLVSRLFRYRLCRNAFQLWSATVLSSSLAIASRKSHLRHILLRSFFQTYRRAFSRLQSHALEASSRLRAMKRVWSIACGLAGHLVASAFTIWLRGAQQQAKVLAASAEKRAALRRVWSVVTAAAGRGVALAFRQWLGVVRHVSVLLRAAKLFKNACARIEKGAAFKAFLRWKEVDKYIQDRLRNRFLGIDMIRHTIATLKMKKVAAGFNSWRAFVALSHLAQREKYKSLKNMLKTVTRLAKRRVFVCFNTWLAFSAGAEAEELAALAEKSVLDLQEKLLNIERSHGLQAVTNVLKSAESRRVSMAFKQLRHAVTLYANKKKVIRSVLAHMMKNALHLSFSAWSEFVSNGQKKDHERRRLARIVRNTLRKMEKVATAKAFSTLKENLNWHQYLLQRKNFAAKLLKATVMKMSSYRVSFTFYFWRKAAADHKASQTEKKGAVAFIFKVSKKSHLLATRRCFVKWQYVLEHRLRTGQQLSRMVTVIGRFLNDLRARAWFVWRGVFIAEVIAARSRDELMESAKSIAEKLEYQQMTLNDKRKESSTFAAVMIRRVLVQIAKQNMSSSFHAWLRHTEHSKQASSVLWQQKLAKVALLNLISLKVSCFAIRKAFLTWNLFTRRVYKKQLESSHCESIRRAVLKKAILSFFKKVLRSAYNSWRAQISSITELGESIEVKNKVLRNVVLRVAKKSLYRAFYLFRKNAAETSSRLNVKRQLILRSSEMIKSFILKSLHASQARAFRSWKNTGEKFKKARSLTIYMLRGIHRSLGKGFGTWTSMVAGLKAAEMRRKSKEKLMKKLLCHMINRLQSLSFIRWHAASRTLAEAERRREDAIKIIQFVMLRACNLRLYAGFNSWRVNTAVFALQEAARIDRMKEVERKKERAIRRALSFMTLRLLSTAYSKWRAVNDHEQRKLHIITRVICRMSNRVMSAAISQWRSENDASRRQEAVIKTMQICMIRACNHIVFSGFNTWKINTILLAKNLHNLDCVRRAMVTTLEFAGATIMRCFTRIEGKNLKNSFALWLRKTQLMSTKERRDKLRGVACHVLVKILRNKQSLTLSDHFVMWRLVCAQATLSQRAANQLKKALHLMIRRNLVLAMNHWRLFISHERMRVSLKQSACSQLQAVLHRNLKNKKGLFFLLWRGNMWRMRMVCQGRSASAKALTLTIISALKRVQHGIVYRLFSRWQRVSLSDFRNRSSKTMAGKQMSRVYSAVFKKQYSKAFNIWRISALLVKNAVSERVKHVTIMVRTIDAILKSTLRSCIKKWVAVIATHKRVQTNKLCSAQLLRRNISQYMFKTAARAFRTWSWHCAKSQISAITALMSNPNQLAQEKKSKLLFAKKREAMVHIFHAVSSFHSKHETTLCSRAWLRWGLFVAAKRADFEDKRRASRLLVRTAGKFTHKRLANAFEILAITSAMKSERNSRFSSGAAVLSRTVRRMLNRLLAKAWSRLKDSTTMLLKKTKIMRRIISMMNVHVLHRGLTTWKRNHELSKQSERFKDLLLQFQNLMLKNIIVSMLEKGQSQGFLRWKLFVDNLKLAEMRLAAIAERKKSGGRRLYDVIETAMTNALRTFFYAWQEKVESERRKEDALKTMIKVANSIKFAHQRAAFHAWCDKVHDAVFVARQRREALRLMGSALNAMLRTKLHGAFYTWSRKIWDSRELARRRTTALQTMASIVHAISRRHVHAAWKSWRSKCLSQSARCMAIKMLKRAVTKMMLTRMSAGLKTWLSFLAECKLEALRSKIRDLSRRDGGYRILTIVRGCFLLTYSKSWRTWLNACSMKRLHTSSCNNAVKKLVKRLAASYLGFAFGFWKTVARQMTQFVRIAEGGSDATGDGVANRWKLCLGLNFCDNFMAKKCDQMKGGAFKRWLDIVQDGNNLRRNREQFMTRLWALLVTMMKKEVVRCFRKWSLFAVEMDKVELKRQMKLSQLKVVLAKAAKDGKLLGFNMLRLVWLNGREERNAKDKRKLVLGKLIRGGTKRSVAHAFRWWERTASITRIALQKKKSGLKILSMVIGVLRCKQLSCAWRKLAFVPDTMKGGGGESEESLRAELKGAQRDLAALKVSTRRLACRSFFVVATTFRRNIFQHCFKVWGDFVQAGQVDERISREYNNLRDIMSSYGRLQSHVV